MSKIWKLFFFFTRYWAVSLSAFALSYYISSLESQELPRFDIPHLDKFVHVLIFTGLSALLWRALNANRQNFNYPKNNAAVKTLCLSVCIIYAFFDEWHQSWTATRTPELMDIVADYIGAIIGLKCSEKMYS